MKTLNVVNNDIDFTIAEDKQEIMRCIELDFGSSLDEYVLDEEIGFNRAIMQDKPTIEDILFEAQRLIANELRVQQVGEMRYQFDKMTRTLNIQVDLEEVATGDIWSQEVSLDGVNE